MKLGLGVYSSEWIPSEGITHHEVYANDLDQAKLADWLRNNTVQTILGPLSWNADGSPKGEFLVGQWQGGVSQVVLPTDVATTDKILHWQGGPI